MLREHSDRRFGRDACGLAVTEAVDERDQRATGKRRDERAIAGAGLPRERDAMDRMLDDGHRVHFFIVTVVPTPGSDCSSKSSISRFAPGRPSPRLFFVE